MTENEVLKCPRCGGELEHGTIFAYRGIYWISKLLTKEALISRFDLSFPNLEGWRCKKCSLAIFDYGSHDRDDKPSYDAQRLQNLGVGP